MSPMTSRKLFSSIIVTLLLPILQIHSKNMPANITLNICSVIEQGKNVLVYNYLRAASAIDMAVEYANDAILLSDIELKFHYKDGGNICAANNRAIQSALDWTREGIDCDVYIGPGCDRAVADLYTIAAYREKPVIGCPSANIEGNTRLKRSEMSLLIRPAYSFTDICRLIIIFLNTFNYTHTVIFADETDQFFFELADTLVVRYRAEREDLYRNTKVLLFRGDETTTDRYRDLLTDASLQARVFILFGNATVVRRLMLTARQLGMTDGDHVYIAVELFKSTSWGEFTWRFHDENERDAQSAYRSLGLISLYETRDQFFSEFAGEVRKRARETYKYTYGASEEVDPIVTSFYDSVILYATTAQKQHAIGRNLKDGPAMALAMRNTTVLSPLGYSIDIDQDGDRTRAYSLRQLSPETGKFEDILRIDYYNFEEIWYGEFRWPGRDSLPPNTPVCGFDGSAEICRLPFGFARQPGLVAGLLSGLIIIVCGSILVGIKLKKKIYAEAAELDPFWWRIRTSDLQYAREKSTCFGSKNKSKAGDVSTADTHSGITGPPGGGATTMNKSNWSNAKSQMAIYMGVPVCLIVVPKKTYKATASLIRELNQVRFIIHPNMHKFIGVCLDELTFCDFVVGEVCSKGTLETVLEDEKIQLDWAFKYSMLKDLVEKGDVFSFGIILQQIILRSAPYSAGDLDGIAAAYTYNESPKDIVFEVKEASIPPMRPVVPRAACAGTLYDLMEQCWAESSVSRPAFLKIKETVRKIVGRGSANIVDYLMSRMEQYANNLEEQVAEKTNQFTQEKQRSAELLSQLLPKVIAAALTKGESVAPESFECVSIYFSDICGFTTICSTIAPMEVVLLLNSLYTLFDGILEHYDVYKVETIGDAYMVSSGLPVRNGKRHASEIANVSLHIRKDITTFEWTKKLTEKLQVRIGIHSGSCVAGIVGHKMPRYCLFGDTVYVASRMEATGEPMKIQASDRTKELLENTGLYLIQERGEIYVKGKGQIKTYWLVGMLEDNNGGDT